MSITREQAKAFLDTLYPCGHMSHLDNPTRIFFAALLGRVPSGMPWDDKTTDDAERLRSMAKILREIAMHIETTEEEASRVTRPDRVSGE